MALVREVDRLDDVPDWARAGYKQVGEKWVNEDVEDVSGLKNTAAARKKERDDLDTQLKAYKALGVPAEQLAEIVKKAKGEGGTDDDVEKRIQKRIDAFKAEHLDPAVKERDALKAENRKLKLTDKVRADFLAAGGLEDEADDVVRLTDGRFDLGEKGKILVLDDEGDATGQSPKEWFEKVYKKSKPARFKGQAGGGSGLRPGDGDHKPGGVLTLTRDQAKDPRQYQAARARADKDGLRLEIAEA